MEIRVWVRNLKFQFRLTDHKTFCPELMPEAALSEHPLLMEHVAVYSGKDDDEHHDVALIG